MKFTTFIDFHAEYMNIIQNETLENFIAFAKKYNIFQDSTSDYYISICNSIKERLEREGLSYDIVRPE